MSPAVYTRLLSRSSLPIYPRYALSHSLAPPFTPVPLSLDPVLYRYVVLVPRTGRERCARIPVCYASAVRMARKMTDRNQEWSILKLQLKKRSNNGQLNFHWISHSRLVPMDGPGTVTWEEFLENAERLLVVSDKISDGWELRGDKDIPGQAYLVRRAKCFLPSDSTTKKDDSNDDDNDAEEFHVKFREDPHEAISTSETPFIIEHHILWSISYSVPVLFFNGWKSDFPGINPVNVNEAQMIHGSKLNYTELSQAIHPIVGTPFLQLHPCLSQGLLRSMSKSKNKLVSWLSCVASAALSLKIHPEYFKLTH